MHDTITINVPFLDEFINLIDRDKDIYNLTHDVDFFGVRGYGEFIRDFETGKFWFESVKHPFESIASDYSNLVIKIYHRTRNCKPYLLLQGSPKILQGHNVFYIDDVFPMVSTMLGLVFDIHPHLFSALDIRDAHFSRIDATYHCRLEHERLVKPVNDMLAKISVGQRKPDENRNIHFNTNYWNSASSRLGYCKTYGKTNDLEKDIKKHKKAAKSNPHSFKLYNVLNNQRLKEYASGLLRFESTNKKEILNQLDIPTNVWEFILYQRKNPKVLYDLWFHWFSPILKSLEGEHMTDITDDASIYKLTRKLFTYKKKTPNYIYLREYYRYDVDLFVTYGKSLFVKNNFNYDFKKLKTAKFSLFGKVSWTIANNAYDFYLAVKLRGWDDVKSTYHKSRFSRSLKNLESIGLSRSFLINLDTQNKVAVVLNEVIKIDFSDQCPSDYTPPATVYDFSSYLKPKLKLVI